MRTLVQFLLSVAPLLVGRVRSRWGSVVVDTWFGERHLYITEYLLNLWFVFLVKMCVREVKCSNKHKHNFTI